MKSLARTIAAACLLLPSIGHTAIINLAWGFSQQYPGLEIEVGDTINWNWTGSGNHNVVIEDSDNNAIFTSGFSSTVGNQESFLFDEAGSFYFYCAPHAGNMFGDVTVLETSPVPVPAAAWLFCSGLIGLVGVARRKRG